MIKIQNCNSRFFRPLLGTFYFSIILEKFNEKLCEYANQIPGLVEMGKINLEFFHSFLEQFEIPFSGPFKSGLGRRKLVYFVSSIRPEDALVNKHVPLYGSYEFELTAFNELEFDELLEYYEVLQTVPFWLLHMPPIFNLSLSEMHQKYHLDLAVV